MANFNSNYEIAQEISARLGTEPIPFESIYSLSMNIYRELGGSEENFDDVYYILLEILPLAEEFGHIIDDTSVRTDKTWSSNKINSELSSKQDTLIAGENIDITDNTVSAVGYKFNGDTNGGFAEKYKQDAADGGQVVENTATGLGSHAEGYSTTASGDYGAHSEGTETVASGNYSHAEGANTNAEERGTHAEGNNTKATGRYSHTEGWYTTTIGRAAHAEGLYTDASGMYSHAEGWGASTLHNLAEGDGSHAEGVCTKATGDGAHAEGFGSTEAPNTASAYGSHAEGCITIAQNQAEHAEGNCNVSHKNSNNLGDAGNTMSSIGIAFVNSGNVRKNAREVMQNGDYYLLGVGGYDGVHIKSEAGYETVKTLQQVINGKQDTLTAGQNIVITNNTISAVIDAGFQVEVVQTLPETGEANTIYFVPKAGGANPDVYDEYMYINNAWEKIGSTEVDLSNYYNKTEVDGLLNGKQDKLTAGNNITINGNTISANDTTYSAGANIEIVDNTIKAVGYRYNTTNGAFAECDRDIDDDGTVRLKASATGVMAHAEGVNTKAIGRASHAEGTSGSATGIQSHAEGSEGNAIGVNSHVEGRQAVANGYASHTEGDGTETGGNYASATTNPKTPDSRTATAGDYAHAEGLATIAYGVASHAEGYKSFVRGNNSHAEGNATIANGDNSHVEGYKTLAIGKNSHAEGAITITNGVVSHAEGRYTKTSCIAEHAQGSYNKSHTDDTADGNTSNGFGTNGSRTIHSIGIGTADNARKNAVEVMQNGDAYLLGVGNYDGIHIKGETDAPSGLKTLQETISGKQDTLTAGENIYIGGNTIYAKGYEYNSANISITNGDACIAEGEYSHAEGYVTITHNYAQYSHAEGVETETYNIGEHAQGRYNVSHLADDTVTKHEGNTIVSVGIGEDGGNRKNAFEIMQNGDIYVYGLGNYNGTETKFNNPEVMTLQDILKTIAGATGVDIGALF